jgi:hypothetical protein
MRTGIVRAARVTVLKEALGVFPVAVGRGSS